MSTITIDLKRRDLETVTILEDQFSYVIAYQYWDSHGKKIFNPDEHPNLSWKRCHVRIDSHKYIDEAIDYDGEDWVLYIDGTKIGNIQGYKVRGCQLYIDMPYGWG